MQIYAIAFQIGEIEKNKKYDLKGNLITFLSSYGQNHRMCTQFQ